MSTTPEVKLCKDCKHCIKATDQEEHSSGWRCDAPFVDLLTGRVIRPNGEMVAWAARERWCGISALWFEPKDTSK